MKHCFFSSSFFWITTLIVTEVKSIFSFSLVCSKCLSCHWHVFFSSFLGFSSELSHRCLMLCSFSSVQTTCMICAVKKREKSVLLFLIKCLIISSAFIYCKYRRNLFSNFRPSCYVIIVYIIIAI